MTRPLLHTSGSIAGLIVAAVTVLGAQKPAPTFSVTTLQGSRFSLEQQRGKVVLIDFWGTWCPSCRGFAPTLVALNKRLTGKPFVMISIAVAEESERAWRRFIADHKMTWPQFLDSKDQVVARFDIHEFPTFVIVDAAGVIREQRAAEGDGIAQWLNERIDYWLAQAARSSTSPPPSTDPPSSAAPPARAR